MSLANKIAFFETKQNEGRPMGAAKPINRIGALRSKGVSSYDASQNLVEDSDSPILILESAASKRRPLTSSINTSAFVPSTTTKRSSVVLAEPVIMETIEKDIVIHEHVHPIQKEEVQPIIYREREQTDLKQVTQLLHETQIHPTIVQQGQYPAEVREMVEKAEPIEANLVLPSMTVEEIQHTQVVHQPIIKNTIKRTIIEEIQPVLERDIIVPVVVKRSQQIYETIVEAPIVERQVVVESARAMFDQSALHNLSLMGFDLSGFNALLGLPALSSTQSTTTFVATPTATVHHQRLSLKEALPSSYTYLTENERLNEKMMQQNNQQPMALCAE